jgi:hypothetical protein
MTYLQHLYPNPHAVTGDLVVFDKAIKRSSRFPLSHLGQAEAYLIERGARTDVYFGFKELPPAFGQVALGIGQVPAQDWSLHAQ